MTDRSEGSRGRIEGFTEALPDHPYGLTINHNPHLAEGSSVREYADQEKGGWVSPDEFQQAIDRNEIWEMKRYTQPGRPERVCASTIDGLFGNSGSTAKTGR